MEEVEGKLACLKVVVVKWRYGGSERWSKRVGIEVEEEVEREKEYNGW